MPRKTKEKGTKAGAQKKKKNAGAGESDCVEMGAPCFSMFCLRDQAEVPQREFSLCRTRQSCLDLPLHSLTFRFHEAVNVGKSALMPPLSCFWLSAFLVCSLHIF